MSALSPRIRSETEDLIYLLSCAVNSASPDARRVAGMDLEKVYEEASRHMLCAAAAVGLSAAGVRDERFERAERHAVLKNAMMDREQAAIFARLSAAGIWHMALKGSVLQSLYPVYGMREMADRDILIDASRAGDVRALMEERGYTARYTGPDRKDDVYVKESVGCFEMHRELFAPGRMQALRTYYRDIQTRLLGEGWEKRFGAEDFYLYLVAHEYMHYSGDGTGLRSALDTCVCLRRLPLDMERVVSEAKRMGLGEFEAANRSLALHLFSGEDALTDADRELLGCLLASGPFGTMDNRVQKRLQRRGGNKVRYALERFFAPLNKKSGDYALCVRAFPFFYRHRLLLPLLPFYRAFCALRSGRLASELKALKKANTEK